MVESSADWTGSEEEDNAEGEGTPWIAPKDSPVTVVAHELRMRYKVRRTDRAPRKGLAARMLPRKELVSVPAVRGVDFTVRQGEFVGIIGRNGSGKSTLLRMLAGVEPPTSGVVLTSARPQLLGVSAALMGDLTGAENIRLGFLALGMTPDEADERFEAAAELSALGSAVDLPMRTYSTGMGARLKFAISVMAEPKILMIDEALSTGDAAFAERSKAKMDEMLGNAGTVFMVNHGAKTIENMCSRAIWMEKGRIVMDGDTFDVTSRYRSFAYRMAQNREEEAVKYLREAFEEGEAQRVASKLTLSDGGVTELPDNIPESDSGDFSGIFGRGMRANRFPRTRDDDPSGS